MNHKTPKNEPTTEHLKPWLRDSLAENVAHCFEQYPKMKDRIDELQSQLTQAKEDNDWASKNWKRCVDEVADFRSKLADKLAENKELKAEIEDLKHKLNGNAVNLELVAEIERLKNE